MRVDIRLWLKPETELPDDFKVKTDKSGNKYVEEYYFHSAEKEMGKYLDLIESITLSIEEARLIPTGVIEVDENTEIIVSHKQHGIPSDCQYTSAYAYHSVLAIKAQDFKGVRKALQEVGKLDIIEMPLDFPCSTGE